MESHSIIMNQKELITPLQLNGIFSCFKVWGPLEQEVNGLFGELIQMTLDSVLWDPSVGDYNQDEEQLRIDEMQGILKPTRNRKIQTMNSHLHPIELPDMKINRNFDSSFHFCSATHCRKGTVSADEIARRWGIGIEAAKRTYTATTQLSIRDFVDSKGMKRLKHTAYQLKHHWL